ncbi:MAG: alpha/beta hydrolase, partial [Burkholderiaceae bacterium]|nr:alpha/beta hydrolase [Burkholderiaceae bacterium]
MNQAKIPAKHPVFPVAVSDIPYRHANGRILRSLLYQPQGEGPFPAIVCVHGGAWVSGDRTATQGFADMLAACGVVVMAIDFRMAPHDPYPSSLVDINFAVRWLKHNAAEYSVDPQAIGGLGVSSGGHLILLSALRPFDARYAAATLPGAEEIDARLAFVVTCSGVLDPLARYRMAQRSGDRDILACHDAYFGSEDVMAEASPPLILERGEPVDLPPALFFQGGDDPRVPAGTAQRMARLCVTAGGQADAVVYPGMGHAIGMWG